MKKTILSTITIVTLLATASIAGDYVMTPNGSYVAGDNYSMAPDGSYVGTK